MFLELITPKGNRSAHGNQTHTIVLTSVDFPIPAAHDYSYVMKDLGRSCSTVRQPQGGRQWCL